MPFILLQTQPPNNQTFLFALFAAFAITWLVFFVYAFFISRRRQEMEREVREMQQIAEVDRSKSGTDD